MFKYILLGLGICWLIFFSYWIGSSFKNKNVVSQEKGYKRFIYYWLPIFVASYLLGPNSWYPNNLIDKKFIQHTMTNGSIGLSLCVVGLIVACWARFILGKNWSGSIQRKEDHELISSGPYQYIRNPIYTGLLMMFLGTAIIAAEYRALFAVLIIFLCFWFKLKKEEKLMEEVFGAKYLAYKASTKSLIPFVF